MTRAIEEEPFDWKDLIRLGLAAGDEVFLQRLKRALPQAGKENGAAGRKALVRSQRQKRLGPELKAEEDERNQIWIRVRLLGERPMDLAREKGYRDGGSILQIVKRVDQRAKREPVLFKKLSRWRKLSRVDDCPRRPPRRRLLLVYASCGFAGWKRGTCRSRAVATH